jgi:hypothetical protein
MNIFSDEIYNRMYVNYILYDIFWIKITWCNRHLTNKNMSE